LFNLIIVHEPGRYEYREALRIIRSVLRENYMVFDSPPPLILLRVKDPYKSLDALREALSPETPILRIIPLDALTYALLDDVKTVALDVAREKIGRGEKFAIKVEGTFYQRDEQGNLNRLHKIDVIRAIASGIRNPVDLDNPDKLILIKSIRISRSTRYAGIMVSSPTTIYSKYAKKKKK